MSDPGEVVKLKLDVPTVQRRCAHYPDALREAVLWLSNYINTMCSRELDVLMETAGKLRIDFDRSTWSRVLRGRWDRSASDKPLETPLVNLERLLRAIEALKVDAKTKERVGKIPFVETSRARAMFHYLEERRAADRVNKFGIIVGRTGTEKTASGKEFCRRNNELMCKYVDAPSKPSEVQFVTDLGVKFGGKFSWPQPQLRTLIYESVNEKTFILVENVQRLYVERLKANQPVFNFLQKLQDDTGCTIGMTLTPVFAETLTRKLADGYFEQFIGRAGGVKEFLRLPDFATREDVVLIANSFGLQEAERHADYLMGISQEPGLIRVLFEALQKGKVAASAAKEELTVEHIKEGRDEL